MPSQSSAHGRAPAATTTRSDGGRAAAPSPMTRSRSRERLRLPGRGSRHLRWVPLRFGRDLSIGQGERMLTQLRFELYKLMMSLAQESGFRKQVVYPLELPTRERIEVEPLAPELPRLLRARNFPASEHAEQRYRRFRRSVPLFRLLSRLPPARTTPIASDREGFLRQPYPERYRRIWPYAPTLPAELAGGGDVLASLAVKGPFAGYLRQAEAADGAQAIGGLAGALDYVIDMRASEQHPVKPGLMRPGGIAIFGVEGSRLR